MEQQEKEEVRKLFSSPSSPWLTSLFPLRFAVTWTYSSLLVLIRRKAKTGSDQIVDICFEWKQGGLRRELENGELAFPSFLLLFLSLSSFLFGSLSTDPSLFGFGSYRGGCGSVHPTRSRLWSPRRHRRFLLPPSTDSRPPAATPRLPSSPSREPSFVALTLVGPTGLKPSSSAQNRLIVEGYSLI